jgi:hypothetical protein
MCRCKATRVRMKSQDLTHTGILVGIAIEGHQRPIRADLDEVVGSGAEEALVNTRRDINAGRPSSSRRRLMSLRLLHSPCNLRHRRVNRAAVLAVLMESTCISSLPARPE